MGSIGYRGNPVIWRARARADEQRAAALADAAAVLAEVEARAAAEIPEALAQAGVVLPVRRRTTKAELATSEQE